MSGRDVARRAVAALLVGTSAVMVVATLKYSNDPDAGKQATLAYVVKSVDPNDPGVQPRPAPGVQFS